MKKSFIEKDSTHGTHFSVGTGGSFQYVDLERSTSHTGVSGYNTRSIGIDMVGNRAYWGKDNAVGLRKKILEDSSLDPFTFYSVIDNTEKDIKKS